MVLSTSLDSEMPEHVAEAYKVWLDAAGRNVYELARITGGRRQTFQTWAQQWRWKERAAVEDIEGRDRAVQLAYYRLQENAGAFVNVTILASRCRVDKDGVHYALDDTGKRVDCPSPVAAKAATSGLATLGISPVKAVTIGATPASHEAIAREELQKLIDAGDTDTLLALAMGRTPPALLKATTEAAEPEQGALEADFALVGGTNGHAGPGREP
jgi:hypothetical protein